MSIKTRLKRIELKSGCGQPTVTWFRTYYRDQNGADYEANSTAVLQQGATYLGTDAMADGENFEAFKARVRQRCFEVTGQ